MTDNTDSSKKLGLWAATALVVGSMIGSGIFSLPTSLAEFGGISLFGWIFGAIGAFTIAQVMAKLSRSIPSSGGPYAFGRAGFGDFTGFLTGWAYWLSIWVTNAAIVITFISYLSVFIPALITDKWLSLVIGLGALWSLTALNSHSVKNGGAAQVITTILKIVPLAAVTIGGFFFINFDHFSPLNISGSTSLQAITVSTALCLFAFLGIEAATVPAGSIKSPTKNIPKAIMLGTIVVTAIYILSSISLFGVLSPEEIANSNSPFADAAAIMWGPNARYLVAAGACISTFGALNGWVLMQGQVPMAMAKDNLFPKSFAKTNKNESPYFGIIASSIITTLLLLLNQAEGLAGVFTYMVLLTTVLNLAAYIFSIGAFGLFTVEQKFGLKTTVTNVILAVASFGFSIWMVVGSGEPAVMAGFIGLLLGIPVYIWNKRKA